MARTAIIKHHTQAANKIEQIKKTNKKIIKFKELAMMNSLVEFS